MPCGFLRTFLECRLFVIVLSVCRWAQSYYMHFPTGHCSGGILPDQANLDTNCYNVLIAHGVADGLPFYKTGRPAIDIDIARCAAWYDYIALGHCRRFAQVAGTTTAFYAGSTAMVTSGDFRPGHAFGFNRVIFDGLTITIEREELKTRPMHAYGLDDASELSSADVLTYLERQLTAVPPDGAYCQVIVEQLDPLVRRALSARVVEELVASAAGLMVSLHAREQRWDAVRSSLLEGGDAVARFIISSPRWMEMQPSVRLWTPWAPIY